MAHPCASKNPPSFCNKKKAKKRKSSCACPEGWKTVGIMCKRGRTMKRSSCAATLGKRRGKRKAKRRSR